MDVGDDTSASDGSLDQGVKFFVSSDSQLQVSGGDSLDLQILGSVSSQFKNLSGEVLEDGSSVNSGSSSDSGVGVHS